MTYAAIYADPAWGFKNYSAKGEAKNPNGWARAANIYACAVSNRATPEGATNTHRGLTLDAEKEHRMATPRIPRLDLTGQQFGRLTVLSEASPRHSPNGDCHRYWLCRCVCETEKEISQSTLRQGKVVSCGCYWDELKPNHRHGKCKTPEYHVWLTMKARCGNPNADAYPRYGGRGIRVCARWMKFENFISDMGERPSASHSVERKDNDGDYEPGNCIWASKAVQSRNRCTNQILEHGGESLTVADWALRLGVSATTLYGRLRRGWSVERVLTEMPNEGPK